MSTAPPLPDAHQLSPLSLPALTHTCPAHLHSSTLTHTCPAHPNHPSTCTHPPPLQAPIDELTEETLELMRGLLRQASHPHSLTLACRHQYSPTRALLTCRHPSPQAHIDELTGEKLELMRGLAQQAKANEALAEDNRALGEQLNALSGKAGAEEAVMQRMQVGGCGRLGGGGVCRSADVCVPVLQQRIYFGGHFVYEGTCEGPAEADCGCGSVRTMQLLLQCYKAHRS